jgi:hypothetical protein
VVRLFGVRARVRFGGCRDVFIPNSIPGYSDRLLAQKFGHELADARAAMEALAKAYTPDQLVAHAYALYEHFRPDVPEGKKGWGAAGRLDLGYIRSLGEEK